MFEAKLEVELGAGIVGYLPGHGTHKAEPNDYDIGPGDPAMACWRRRSCRITRAVTARRRLGIHRDILGLTFSRATVEAGGH